MTSRPLKLFENAVELKLMRLNNYIITQEIVKSGEGYSAEWWVSQHLHESITLVGTMSLPVYGETKQDAEYSAGHIGTEVIQFIINNSKGTGTLHTKPRQEAVFDIGRTHLKAHRVIHTNPLKGEQTLIEYLFLRDELGIKAGPAVLLARLDNLPITTIKRRINKLVYGY